MTYENAAEVEVLKSLWRPGAPLENTVFAILDPNGRPLTRGARDPGFIFADAHAMANGLNDLARRYQGRGNPQYLPTISTVRLAMNVAAADKKPLTIVVSDSQSDRQSLANYLAPLAWSDGLIGKISYSSGSRFELQTIQGARLSRGYLFVLPDEFGTSGTVVAQLSAQASQAELRGALQMTIDRYRPSQLDHHEHIRLGQQQGIHWDSATPVTDPHQPGLRSGSRFSEAGPGSGQGEGFGEGPGEGPGRRPGRGPGGWPPNRPEDD